MILEIIDPVKTKCSRYPIPDIAKESKQLQSTYVGVVKHVLKDSLDKTTTAGLRDTLSFKPDHSKTQLVQVQYMRDTECCDEPRHGQLYVALGIPLPLSSDQTRIKFDNVRVHRMWAESMFDATNVLGELLQMQTN